MLTILNTDQGQAPLMSLNLQLLSLPNVKIVLNLNAIQDALALAVKELVNDAQECQELLIIKIIFIKSLSKTNMVGIILSSKTRVLIKSIG